MLGIASRTSWTASGATGPVAASAGAVLTVVRVAITDSTNAVVTTSTLPVTLTISGNTAPLGGTTTVAAVNGIATFTDLVITKAGSYRFIASAPGMLSGQSAAFTITAAGADHLEFTVQPTTVAAGALFSPAVQVSVLDAFGNPALAPSTVTVALADNPGASTLSGTTVVNTSTGRANFASLKLNRPSTGYSLVASVSGLTNVLSAAFDVQLGAASRFVVISGSGQSANAGAAVIFPLVVESQDVSGNKVANVPVDWVMTIGNGTLSGASVTDAAGRAQASVVLGTASGAQRVEARSPGLTTGAFALTSRALAASQFSLVSGDGQTGVVNEALASPLVVAVADLYGNPVSNQPVIFSVVSGGASLSATTPRTDATGRATVTATLGTVVGNAVVTATKAGLTGSPVTFTATGVAGATASVVFSAQPTATEVGTVLAPLPLLVRDAFGNAVDGAAVTLSLAGVAGATLGGTTTALSSLGAVSFGDLSVDRIGTGFTLTATVGAAAVTSSPFDVTCPAGLTACAGACVDATTDLGNCGACGVTCGGPGANGLVCESGSCRVTACAVSRGDCDANAANGCETDVATTEAHCGACGRACPAGVMCVQGMCGSDEPTRFSAASNPNGPWTYGSKASSGAGTFTAFTTGGTDGSGNQVWSNGGEAAVTFNGTGGPTAVGQGTLPAQSLALMPATNETAVVRYTAQAAGTYRAYVDFEGLVDSSETITLSEQRCRTVRYCRPYYAFCIYQAPEYAVHTWESCDFFNCGNRIATECPTQSATVSKPVRSTPEIQVLVNGQSAWGRSTLNDAWQSSYVDFGWDTSYYGSPAVGRHYYSWPAGDPRQHGALTLTLGAGDVIDFTAAPGPNGNTADLTKLTVRLELACASGFADCDGDAANGCEVELSLEGGSCSRSAVARSSSGLESETSNVGPDSISGDGRYVAFSTTATNLVPGVTGQQIYLRDTRNGVTTLVTREANGTPGNAYSTEPVISADGRWIVFASAATNLASGVPGNSSTHLLLFDRIAGSFEQIDVDAMGISANGYSYFARVSDDGRFVAFLSNSTTLDPSRPKSTPYYDVFVKDRASGEVRRVMPLGVEPNQSASSLQLSGDGTTVAFDSYATNLVDGDTNSRPDVFTVDLGSAAFERLTNGSDYSYLRALSRTGQRVVHQTGGTLFLVDRAAATSTALATGWSVSFSGDGRWVGVVTTDALTVDDTNGRPDAFVYDTVVQSWTLVSTQASSTLRSAPAVSTVALAADGRTVLFVGSARTFAAEVGAAGSEPFVTALLRPAEVNAVNAPSSVIAGANFTVSAALFDDRGSRVRVSGVPTTLSLVTGPSGATFDPMIVTSVQGTSPFPLALTASGRWTFSLAAPGYASRMFSLDVGSGAPASLVLVSGDAQTASVARALAPFVVRVLDANGNPVAGQRVDWSVVQAAGSITPTDSLTDAAGETTATATLATLVGSNSFLATSGALTLAFTSMGVAGDPAAISWAVQPSNTTAGVVMSPAPTLALVDAYGNPVDNISVQASVSFTGIDLPQLHGELQVPMVNGFATFSIWANEARIDSIAGGAAGFVAQSQLFTIAPGPIDPAASIVSAQPTAEANGTATVTIAISAFDQFGNAVSGAIPDVFVTGSGNTLSPPGPTLNGLTSALLSSTRAESKTITASLNGLLLASSAQVTFTPLSTCGPDASDCNGDSTDGCEVDLTSTASCGACGVACGTGMSCTSGACTCPATAPTACGTGATAYCADLTADVGNCGACGTSCGASQACTPYGCTDTCSDAQPPDEVVALELEPTGTNLVAGVSETTAFKVWGRMLRTPWQRVDVTAQAAFSSSDPGRVDVTTAGVVSSPGNSPGVETLTASLNGHTATARVRVWDPSRFAELTELSLVAPGFSSPAQIGTCFPVQCTATFSDSSTEDVSETVDFGVFEQGAPVTSPRALELRVLDQNLLTVSGAPLQPAGVSHTVELLAQLIPNGLSSARLNASVEGPVGTCADPRFPGSVLSTAIGPGASALQVNQSVTLTSVALRSGFALTDESVQAQLRTCAPAVVHVQGAWATGVSAGTAVVSTTVGAHVGHAEVIVSP